jgi:hypothetical protein
MTVLKKFVLGLQIKYLILNEIIIFQLQEIIPFLKPQKNIFYG